MAVEAELKFLPINDTWWPKEVVTEKTCDIKQGYVDLEKSRARIRVTTLPDGSKQAYIFLKNKNADDKHEFELQLPVDEKLKELLRCCQPKPIEKTHVIADLTGQEAFREESTRQYDIKPDSTVRVRISTKKRPVGQAAQPGDVTAQLCIKGPKEKNAQANVRLENEYDLPVALAETMIAHVCASTIDKTRYLLKNDDPNIECTLDQFKGNGKEKFYPPLEIVEIELKNTDLDASYLRGLTLKPYLSKTGRMEQDDCAEVTYNPDFTNKRLSVMGRTDAVAQEVARAAKIGGKGR